MQSSKVVTSETTTGDLPYVLSFMDATPPKNLDLHFANDVEAVAVVGATLCGARLALWQMDRLVRVW